MSRYCTCGARTSIEDMSVVVAPKEWEAWEAYKCNICNKLSHAAQPEEPPVYAPFGAVAPLHAHGNPDGIWVTAWAMPDHTRFEVIEYKPYPRRSVMDQGRNYLLELWKLLDEKTKIIIEYDPLDNMIKATAREHTTHQARGVAETISILMVQYYPTADSVVREAVERHKAAKSGEQHQSPGLAEELWQVRRPGVKTVAQTLRANKAAPRRRAASVPLKLDDKDKTGIKNAMESGMFSAKDIAAMFKITEAEVKAVVKG